MTTQILEGDCRDTLKTIPEKSVHCCVTSPPYFGLRDYGNESQIGLEQTPEAFVQELVSVFREVKRVLRDNGTLWLNIGDSYAANRTYQVPSTKGGPKHSVSQSAGGKGSVVPDGCKPKDLIGVPWMLAFALRSDGWYLRQDIIWHKPNPMPESVQDRCTKSHEYIFLMSKSERYFYDADAIRENAVTPIDGRVSTAERKELGHPTRYGMANRGEGWSMPSISAPEGGKNKRSVWTVTTKPYSGAHFAAFPPDLIEPCILAGCPKGGTVLDPFGGSGTTAQVAMENNRSSILCELNPEYVKLINHRLAQIQPSLL